MDLKCGGAVASHQVASSKDTLKMFRHRVVLHGHEKGIEDNADGDG